MGIPVNFTKTLATADPNGICLSQAVGAAGNLVLTGAALVSGGVAYLLSGRKVIVTSAGNDSGITFTIYGTRPTGQPLYETITGAAVGIATTRQDFFTVTRVAASGAAAGVVEVGTSAAGASEWVSSNIHIAPAQWSIAVDVVSGSVTYSLEYTYDDFWTVAPNGYPQPVPFAWTDAVMNGETTDQQTSLALPITGWRIAITAGTGTIECWGIQAGIRGN